MSRIEEGRKKEYVGEGIVVRYEPRRCIHAGAICFAPAWKSNAAPTHI